MRRLVGPVLAALVVAGIALGAWAWSTARKQGSEDLLLYGNVEVRQVDLAFGVEGPIASVLVDEGDRVEPGQTLAALDQAAFQYAEASAEAVLKTAEARLAELVAGSRAQEVERSEAAVASAEATQENAATNLKRTEELFQRGNAPKQGLDAAQLAMRAAESNLREARANLALCVEGTRTEQITQQEAEREARRADLGLQRYRLARATLKAPSPGVVLTRIREPGAVVLPSAPVLTLALVDPVWIRVYVDGPNLGRVATGTAVMVTTDAAPGHAYQGRIGYVSPTAEFTPKSVETPELRTTLVYRARVLVQNPDRRLLQGMPVTVTIGQAPAPGNQ
jgi:HlyD family secretion protein